MKTNHLLVCVLSTLILFACANPQTGGIGLRNAPPKPTPQQDITEQSKKVIDAYNSLSYLPEAGFEKISEYTRVVKLGSKDYCKYIVTESMVLLETDPEILIQKKYKQAFDSGSSDLCPVKDSFLVDETTTQKFRDYANEKIAKFYEFSDLKTYLEKYSDVKSAEVTIMQSMDFQGLSALRVRMKIIDDNNQVYFLQTTFSKDNSFLAILDQQLTRVSDGKVMSYIKRIVP